MDDSRKIVAALGLAGIAVGAVLLGKKQAGGDGGEGLFAYVSPARLVAISGNDYFLEVDIQNLGDTEATYTSVVHHRREIDSEWSGWAPPAGVPQNKVPPITLGSFDVGTLSVPVWAYPLNAYQFRIVGSAGSILAPATPLEYLCNCHWDQYGYYEEFATYEEAEEHAATDHGSTVPGCFRL